MLSRNLRDVLNSRHITLESFAQMCGLPMETVRNIYYGKSLNPKIGTVLAMANALGVTVNRLMGEPSHTQEEDDLLTSYRECGNHGKNLLALVAKFEMESTKEERLNPNKYRIPCVSLDEEASVESLYNEDEMIEIETSNNSAYISVKLAVNDFTPTYCKGDIILVTNRFPKHGEHAVFFKGHRLYLRKYMEEDRHYRLKCLKRNGQDIVLKRMDEIECIGTCCGVVRA